MIKKFHIAALVEADNHEEALQLFCKYAVKVQDKYPNGDNIPADIPIIYQIISPHKPESN